MSIKIHIKNNRWAEGSFPNTPMGEEVFTITEERFATELKKYPYLKGKFEVFIDWDTDHYIQSMANADILLAWNFPTKSLAVIAPKLTWIHCIGSGIEHLSPLNWLPEKVTLTNNKGVHGAKAGEFILMSVLMLHSHLPAIITNQKNHVYDSLYATAIAGKTVVILGTGSLGSAGAKKMRELGVHVIGVNRSGRAVEGCDEVVTTLQLDAVLPRADYLVIAIPETQATRNLINRQRLNLLKPTAGVINIGREAVMDYDALIQKLEDGSLSGAILDVFNREPIPKDSALWRTKNLMITPHISADDGDAYIAMTLKLFFQNLGQYLQGKPLANPVNREFGY